MAKVIVYKNPDNSLEILRPCIRQNQNEDEYEYLSRVANLTYPNREFKIAELPHGFKSINGNKVYEEMFRTCWILDNKNNIVVDKQKSKEVWKNKIKEYSEKAILKLNEEIQLYLEQGDLESIKEIGEVKQILKGVHNSVDEIEFYSLEHLRSYWPTILNPPPDFVLNIPTDIFISKL